MQVVSIVAPTPFLTADVVRARLGVAMSIDDARLSAFAAVACALLDGPDGWLGRSVAQQTIEIALPALPRRLLLPYPPVVEVQSVTIAGVAVDASSYSFDGIRTLYVSDAVADVAVTDCERQDRVRIRYTTGNASTPAPIEQAVVMAVAKMLVLSRADAAVKQDTVVGVSSTVWETAPDFATIFDRAAECLLAPYRVFA